MAPQTFTYLGSPAQGSTTPTPVASAPAPCVVPKLRGKELKAARKRIKAADCKLGKVTRKGTVGRGAKVVKQTPKAGTVRAAGSKVDVVLGAA